MKWIKKGLEQIPKSLIRSTILKMCDKSRETGVPVGTCLAGYLFDRKIRYDVDDGCHCYRLMRTMNTLTPDVIEEDIAYWTDVTFESSKRWYRRYVAGEEPTSTEPSGIGDHGDNTV